MKRVLLIQHVWENPTGYVGEILQEHHIAYDIVNVEAEALPDPAMYDAIIAFGGTQHAYDDDKYSYFAQEKALIRQAVEQDIPYLGICLGGQLLASALNGAVRQHSVTEIGFYDVQFTEAGRKDPLYQGLPGYQKVFHWHEDTFDLPVKGVLIATSQNTENQAFRYGRRAYGLQYHIEITPEMLHTWLHHPSLQDSSSETPEAQALRTLEREGQLPFSLYHAHTRIMLENFLCIGGLL